jgi:hypothetical protein
MKDARYGRIRVVILVALVAFSLFYFNVLKPVFEDRMAEARIGRMIAERDEEDIAEIKNSPEAFDKKIEAIEMELTSYEERVGLTPVAAPGYLTEKAVNAGLSEADISIAEGGESAFTSSVSTRAYTVTLRAGYDEGTLFMKEVEGEGASWSVDELIYDGGDGGSWIIDLSLRYLKENG